MKEKDLVIIYRAFVNLYGAILDKEAYEIIKNYFPEFTYEEFKKDLKRRVRKSDRSYSVRKWTEDEYVIRGSLNNKETKSLFILQEDKPYFVPRTFEELKKFVYAVNLNIHTDDILKKISRLFIKYVSYFDSEFAKTLAFALAEDTQIYVLKHIHSTDVVRHLRENNGIDFSQEDEKEYLNLYRELRLETRTWEDKGYTKREINEVYYYEKLFRPIVNLEPHTFLSGMLPEDVDVICLNKMVENARTLTKDEKEIVKKEILNCSLGIQPKAA